MSLTWSSYVEQAQRSNQFKGTPEEIRNLRFGYFGQVGSLMSAVKRSKRDFLGSSAMEFSREEIGDALWYLCALAVTTGVTAEELGLACLRELHERFRALSHAEWPTPTFRQGDGVIAAQRVGDLGDVAAVLREVAYQAGVLLHADEPQGDFRCHPHPDKQLGKLAAGLALAAERCETTLEAAAEYNLIKTKRRWPGENPVPHPLLDERYEKHEQFQRRFTVRFDQRGTPDRPIVTQSIEGVFVGDSLTDNISDGDGYRFHDVFHLAYVAHLGWSPVVRALLKRKRKSDKKVDENEDGARAQIIEEGIATWIFNHAKGYKFYEDVKEGQLDHELLKQVDQMVKGYEVDKVPLWQWERAILSGMEVFRNLLSHGGGSVTVDMLNRKLGYTPPQARAP